MNPFWLIICISLTEIGLGPLQATGLCEETWIMLMAVILPDVCETVSDLEPAQDVDHGSF